METAVADRKGLPRFVWFLIAASATFAVLALVAAFARARKVDLPLLGEVPPLAMTDQRGRPITTDALRGQPFIADFIFLSCKASCPKLTARMKGLHDRALEKNLTVRLVSITVDPENDTPDKLLAYANAQHASHDRWLFLTGPIEQLDPVVVKGFKMQYEKVKPIDPNSTLFTIMHGDWFVLVDGKGRIRGYYDTDRPEKLDAVLRDAEILARNPDR